ncbi:cytochrome b/b6 domain-containing protein [Erythrobacter dokdonensis]|uniref:Putative integral membrane protein n=1 Tax=Erythrobacter dokdonensis DSW-74 TaxID=1300349 RepID=A0A1A7BL49_9SPHN|nr:cytochrome b/b6 domain-containing protein [Erythrobacter dokdonensis]OBV12207.1 putative integral membrane protein [Erythrobacter dokdonensis DSW-74]
MNESSGQPRALAPDVRVWDPLLRLAHWSFPLLIAAMWWTAENSKWALHRRMGLALFGILALRVLWGFLGPETARFSQFVKAPGKVLAYLRGDRSVGPQIGHSPLGGWSTIALIGAMMLQVGMGLFAGDPYDGMTGPLNPLVGVMTADTITELHETFFWVLVAMIALHLAAITFYAVKGDDLLSPMVGGARPPMAQVAGIGPTPWARAALAVGLAAGLALWVTYGAPPLT